MKKVGQPATAKEITGGRDSLLRQLYEGVADKDGMAAAANWIRDMWKEGVPGFVKGTENTQAIPEIYDRLMKGEATDYQSQRAAATWLAQCCGVMLISNPGLHFRRGEMTVNEAREQMGLDPIREPGANTRQPGGDHYMKKPIQHWDFVVEYDYSYLSGQVSRYLCRWVDKGGLLDLEKSVHYLEKQLEVTDEAHEGHRISLPEFLAAQKVGEKEQIILSLVHAYETSGMRDFLLEALRVAKALRDETAAAGAPPPRT
jgi:hypothetical protein